ncbi:MAG: hypothetical protein IJ391_01895 [Clostridia bacterium]|nr:hypothetical protein [Clostridia bacterium]
MEQIYTIPVNEAFDKSAADPACGCPFCTLYKKLQNDNLELILGASMMEPDVRIRTNKLGFCADHYDMMFNRKNRLGLALMLESHMDELRDDIGKKLISLAPVGDNARKRLDELSRTCYVCERIDFSLSKMLETALLLYEKDGEFVKKFKSQPYFCLKHFNRLSALAKAKMSKKLYASFYEDASAIVFDYMDSLRGDIKHFIKKFDYRYENEPWGNSKDSVERAIKFLEGDAVDEK